MAKTRMLVQLEVAVAGLLAVAFAVVVIAFDRVAPAVGPAGLVLLADRVAVAFDCVPTNQAVAGERQILAIAGVGVLDTFGGYIAVFVVPARDLERFTIALDMVHEHAGLAAVVALRGDEFAAAVVGIGARTRGPAFLVVPSILANVLSVAIMFDAPELAVIEPVALFAVSLAVGVAP